MILFIYIIMAISLLYVGSQEAKRKIYQEAIKHHAARYVNNGQTPDVVFRWNDEVKE